MSQFKDWQNRRIAVEIKAMRSHFPKFELRQADRALRKHRWTVVRRGQLFWSGPLTTYSGAGYLVMAVYPHDYPCEEIKSYVVDPYLPTTEHRFQDGHLCLYDHSGAGAGYDSDHTTVVTIIAWTAAWLHAYEIWRQTGQWPTLDNNHSGQKGAMS